MAEAPQFIILVCWSVGGNFARRLVDLANTLRREVSSEVSPIKKFVYFWSLERPKLYYFDRLNVLKLAKTIVLVGLKCKTFGRLKRTFF